MQLFYAPPENIGLQEITLPADEARHAVQVLRAKPGDILWVTDGCGKRYRCALVAAGKHSAVLEIQDLEVTDAEHLPILAVGLLKNRDRIEWLAEKTVEIGITKLILMQTSRSERGYIREDRIRGIQISAMKQCLASWLPELEIRNFEDVITTYAGNHPSYIAHEKADIQHRFYRDQNTSPPLLLVGPEGGFTDEEVTLARDAGAQLVSLGIRRLRTETAAIKMLIEAG